MGQCRVVVFIAGHVVCVSNTLSYIHAALSYYIGVAASHHFESTILALFDKP